MNPYRKQKPEPTPEELAARAKSKALARKMVITLVIACVVLVGLDVLSKVDFTPLIEAIQGGEEKPDIQFHYPNFEEDIMTDSSYLGKIRLMGYKDGGQMTLINEDDYYLYSPAVNRMHDFFAAAIAGDLDAYNACFTQAYHEENDGERTEPFTMQRIYDMMIELIGEVNVTGTDTVRTFFRVEYRIQKNNGTFRDDMGSDCTLPQVFELTWNTETKECRIASICYPGEFDGVPYPTE